MKYFDHDTDACKDELIQALRIECGGAAVDAYWCILELMYKEETDLVFFENQPLTKSVTHWLCIDWKTFETYFSAMRDIGLIDVSKDDDGAYTLHSERAAKNIGEYRKRIETARQNGAKGGRKPRPNQRLTKGKPKPNRSLTQPKAKEKEKEKVLDTHKGYPNTYAEGAADAVETAPPSCPQCRIPMEPTSTFKSGTNLRLFRCEECGEEAFA